MLNHSLKLFRVDRAFQGPKAILDKRAKKEKSGSSKGYVTFIFKFINKLFQANQYYETTTLKIPFQDNAVDAWTAINCIM